MTKMKPRPNLTPEEFMAGSVADRGEQRTTKHKKLIEFPYPIFIGLKNLAAQETVRTGKRVTDTSLIMDALTKYLNL